MNIVAYKKKRKFEELRSYELKLADQFTFAPNTRPTHVTADGATPSMSSHPLQFVSSPC